MASERAAADRDGADSDEGLIFPTRIRSRRDILKELEAEKAARLPVASCESIDGKQTGASARAEKGSKRKNESRKTEGSSTQAPAAPRRKQQKTSVKQADSELQMPTWS